MADNTFGFKGSRGVSISDPLFIYVQWEERANPKTNPRLDEIITDLDTEYFANNPKINIRNSLPFLTFRQTEMLFKAIKQNFDYFGLEGVALCRQVNSRGKLTGKVSLDDSPMIVPFGITQEYDNIVLPIIEATFKDERFQAYSYEYLAKYFCSGEYNLMDSYGASLGLSRTEYPLFPRKGEIEGALDRPEEEVPSKKKQTAITRGESKNVDKTSYYDDYEEPVKHDKLHTVLIGVIGVLAFSSLCYGFIANNKIKQQETKLEYLYNELKSTNKLQENEHKIDSFGRYFLAQYYSGNKDNIKPFLSSGDVKYTQPEAKNITSLLVYDVSVDGNVYTISYIVGFKEADGSTTTQKISFNCKKSKTSEWGWVVVSEPLSSAFGTSQSKGE